MWSQTLLVVTVISCLGAVLGEEDTASSSTQYFIALAQCEAECYSTQEERNGSTIEREDTGENMNSRLTECLNARRIEASSLLDCSQKCNFYYPCSVGCVCMSLLRSSPVNRSVVEGPGPSAPQLHCREATMLSVVWECSGEPVFVLLYRSTGDSKWRPWNTTRKKLATLYDLTQGTLYQFRVLAILQDGQLGDPSTSDWITTLNDTFYPGPVKNISHITEYRRNPSRRFPTLQTKISWEPAWDWTCFYEVVFLSNNIKVISIEKPEKLEYISDYQKFGTNYSIAIMGKNKDRTRESDKTWLNFTTPDCFYYYPNDSAICDPRKPENVSVEVIPVILPVYDVTVSWAKPVLQPPYFTVSLFMRTDSVHGHIVYATGQIVPGNSTSVAFSRLELYRHLEVNVTALTPAGDSEAATITIDVQSLLSRSYPDSADK